jgi:hypothetical protein
LAGIIGQQDQPEITPQKIGPQPRHRQISSQSKKQASEKMMSIRPIDKIAPLNLQNIQPLRLKITLPGHSMDLQAICKAKKALKGKFRSVQLSLGN